MKKKLKAFFTDFGGYPDTLEYIEKHEFVLFLSRFYDIDITSENPDVLFFSCYGFDFLKFDCTRIFYTPEYFKPDLNIADYAISFHSLNSSRHYRLSYWRINRLLDSLLIEKDVDKIIREKDKFCNFIFSNYRNKLRNSFYKKLSSYKHVDSPGVILNNTGYIVWGKDKIEFQRRCKFSITFENSSYPDYLTEKIIDAMAAHSIPIYWGDPLVGETVNEKSFINCNKFNDMDDAIELIKEIDTNDELLKQYLSEPYFVNKDELFEQEQEFFSWLDRSINQDKKRTQFRKRQELYEHIYRLKFKFWWQRKAGILSRLSYFYNM